jgi:hypothetical protein
VVSRRRVGRIAGSSTTASAQLLTQVQDRFPLVVGIVLHTCPGAQKPLQKLGVSAPKLHRGCGGAHRHSCPITWQAVPGGHAPPQTLAALKAHGWSWRQVQLLAESGAHVPPFGQGPPHWPEAGSIEHGGGPQTQPLALRWQVPAAAPVAHVPLHAPVTGS